ncbi:hypothetical protein [Alkalicoccus halolimnae]|uniref:EcsC family protein n=1 Tax=Alkalicoccus halolimnae TaxID=1667239 RepID=A0A5C7FHD0_9BACI|nr:hypothetical protein [Alkalicoccus halolimnae]TXF85549.1 hypothetical protein FTX54_08130 [Alkalicoccus halolimnae]
MEKLTTRISNVIVKAGKLPGYKMHPYETYRRLNKDSGVDKLQHPREIYYIDQKKLDKAADKAITKHKQRFAATGAAVGAPGGPVAMFGGAVIDVEEYVRRMFLLTQELGHIYGVLPNPFTYEETGSYDDYFDSIQHDLLKMMLLGLGGSGVSIDTLDKKDDADKKEPAKVDEEVMYKVAVKIADIVGKKKMKKHAAKMMGRSVPLVGGGINGTLNYYFLNQLGKNTKKHLKKEHEEVRAYLNR